jgi:signal transduction histidine kinase
MLIVALACSNHVMDYAKISGVTRNVSSRTLLSAHTVRLSSKPPRNRRSRAGAFDLSIATEEVIEAVFSGSSYVPVTGALMDAASSPSPSEPDQTTNRKICYIVLDVASEDDWIYCFPVGSWRRIVMNIFGNAIKYTESGHIHVSLRTNAGSRVTDTPTSVTLTITDSGMGMSPQFLANKAFQPFTQENSVSSTIVAPYEYHVADFVPSPIVCSRNWIGTELCSPNHRNARRQD